MPEYFQFLEIIEDIDEDNIAPHVTLDKVQVGINEETGEPIYEDNYEILKFTTNNLMNIYDVLYGNINKSIYILDTIVSSVIHLQN